MKVLFKMIKLPIIAKPTFGVQFLLNQSQFAKLAMPRIAFKMQLHPGQADTYKRRHDALWPELETLLKETGIEDYSIFLDPETNTLFGVLKIEDPVRLDELPAQPVMQRWWAYMADIMATNPDLSPRSQPLQEVFYLA